MIIPSPYGSARPVGLLVVAVLALFTSLSATAGQTRPVVIGAEISDWRAGFDEVCASVDRAMDLGRSEAEELLFRCRVLEQRINELQNTQKKVYGRRLRACRDLLQFVLEQKYGNETGTAANEAGRSEKRDVR